MTLTFTTQNNGVRREKIDHKVSGNPLLCLKSDLLRSVLHLSDNGESPYNPITRVMMPIRIWKNITPTMISKTLQIAVMFYSPNLGFEAKDVSARSLCTAGAIALLCSVVDRNIINLIGQ